MKNIMMMLNYNCVLLNVLTKLLLLFWPRLVILLYMGLKIEWPICSFYKLLDNQKVSFPLSLITLITLCADLCTYRDMEDMETILFLIMCQKYHLNIQKENIHSFWIMYMTEIAINLQFLFHLPTPPLHSRCNHLSFNSQSLMSQKVLIFSPLVRMCSGKS